MATATLVLVPAEAGTPLRPGILHGVNMRSTEQVERLTKPDSARTL